MNNYICIHGHFYQPPRENPWLNEVELQESAHPFHDWNERITEECYARNSASRILDEMGSIVDIMNNYAHISFNFGPTLLEWMEKKAPDTYKAILEADKQSQKRFSGHGSALAQAYNHMIMPLANNRDKHTQVIWGIYDFRKRFGREPEGMWLGETAANLETLEVLADHGIKFTILSPYQAKRFRKLDELEWQDGTGARIDPKKSYLCNLPSGKSMVLFFYDAPVSQGVAFERLLTSGVKFADRLMSTFDNHPEGPELMHIATDGETYGHHHRFGEMALSYALHHIEKEKLATITIYGEYLEKHPPRYEAEIIEDTSWSCSHGVERWRSNCGCHTGGSEEWHQRWRGPLRNAFDWLRDEVAPLYEQEMAKFGVNAWEVRNNYIQVVMDRSEDNVARFIKSQTNRELSKQEEVTFLRLLEMQYHAMLMYTSCGWFFDEVTGIETIQDIFYAARVVQLASVLSGNDYEPRFLELLQEAESNDVAYGNAATAYVRQVKPAILDLTRVGAHYAVASVFAEDPANLNLYSYQAKSEHYEILEAGRQKMAIGKANIRSTITWSEETVSFAVLHLGEHQLLGGVRKFMDENTYAILVDELTNAFNKGNLSEVMMLLDKHFESHHYSFWHLFKDDQRKILSKVLEQTIQGIDRNLEQVYYNNFPIMNAINDLGLTLPRPLQLTTKYMINSRLQQHLREDKVDVKAIKRLLTEAKRMHVKLNKKELEYEASQQVDKLIEKLDGNVYDSEQVNHLIELLSILKESPLKPDYWQAENKAFRLKKMAETTDHVGIHTGETTAWNDQLKTLFNLLNLKTY
jgi:hypothetical protein